MVVVILLTSMNPFNSWNIIRCQCHFARMQISLSRLVRQIEITLDHVWVANKTNILPAVTLSARRGKLKCFLQTKLHAQFSKLNCFLDMCINVLIFQSSCSWLFFRKIPNRFLFSVSRLLLLQLKKLEALWTNTVKIDLKIQEVRK